MFGPSEKTEKKKNRTTTKTSFGFGGEGEGEGEKVKKGLIGYTSVGLGCFTNTLN